MARRPRPSRTPVHITAPWQQNLIVLPARSIPSSLQPARPPRPVKEFRDEAIRRSGCNAMTMRRQQGFVLLELIVAVLLAALLAGWGTQALINKINDAGAQAHA